MTNFARSGPTTTCAILGAAAILLLAAALFCYVSLDGPLLEQLASHPVNWHRITWVNAFRQLGKAQVPLWLLVLWAATTGRSRPLVVAAVALILSMLMVVPLKAAAGRLRPSAVLAARTQARSAETLRAADRASFPSGDAATGFAVATAVASQVTWVAWPLLYAGAAGIGVLRVTGMNHFPSDVCAGAAAGLIAGCLAVWVRRKIRALAQIEMLDLRGRQVLAGVAAAVLLGLLAFDRKDPLVIFLGIYWPAVAIATAAAVLLKPQRTREEIR